MLDRDGNVIDPRTKQIIRRKGEQEWGGKLSYNHKKSWEFISYQVEIMGATLSVVCSH